MKALQKQSKKMQYQLSTLQIALVGSMMLLFAHNLKTSNLGDPADYGQVLIHNLVMTNLKVNFPFYDWQMAIQRCIRRLVLNLSPTRRYHFWCPSCTEVSRSRNYGMVMVGA